jgi:hypothetical protein
MKRQPRPFTVEIKSLRPRSSLAGSLTSSLAVEAFDPFPDDLPVRDVHEDLVPEIRGETSTKSEALREAERVFAGLTTRTPGPLPAPDEARSPSPVEPLRARSPALPADAGSLGPRAPEAEVPTCAYSARPYRGRSPAGAPGPSRASPFSPGEALLH